MAIQKFDGTTSGSDSGWTRRFSTEFSGSNGHAWRVEIIDSGSAAGTFSQSESTDTPMVLADGGFLIEYDGDNDTRRTPLVASSCSLLMICTEDEHLELVSAIHANEDHRFGIAVYVFEPDGTDGTGGADLFADGNGWWRPFWFGTIFADQGEADYLKTQANFSLTAQCGLALLNDEKFVKPDGEPWTDEASLAKMIGRCFDLLPTKSLWGWNDYDGSTTVNRDFNQTAVDRALANKPRVPFFRECVWIYDKDKHNDGDASILDNTACSSMAFLEIAEQKDDLGGVVRKRQYVSCSQVLEHIAAVLGARIFLADGSWWFQNMDQTYSSYDRHEFVYFDIYHLKTAGSANQTNTPLENSVAGSVLDLYGKGFSFTDEVKVNVMFPVRMVESVHVEGGSRLLAGTETAQSEYTDSTTGNTTFGWQEQNVGIFYDKVSGEDTWECQPITFANDGATIEGGQNITINGAIQFHNLGQQHWSDNDVNSANAKGMRYLIRLKIKCGDYYLKRAVTTRSETADIKNGIGTTIKTQKFWEQDGDVEWTLTEDTYDFGLPRLGGDPEGATVELTDDDGPIDFDFVGGFHTVNRGGNNTDQFKCVEGAGNTMYGTYKYELGWTLPELPTGVVHEGVSVEFTMAIYNSENSFMQGTAVRDILDDGSTGFGIGEGKEIGFLDNLQILYADGTSDVEVKFISLVDKNTTSIVTAESVLGDKYTETQTNRALKVLDADGGASKFADGEWTTLDQADEDGKLIHQLLADETMEKRHKPLEIRTVNLAFTDHDNVPNPLSSDCGNHAQGNWKIPTFARVFKIANTNGVNEWFQPLEMSFSPNTTEMTMCHVKTSRDVTGITNIDNTDIVRGPQGGGGKPLGTLSTQPVHVGRNPNGGGSTGGTINAIRRRLSSSESNVTDIQGKTDFITIGSTGITGFTIQSGATPLRAGDILTNPLRTFATNAQLLQIAQNELTASGNTSSVLTNAGNISTNATNITSTTAVANTANSRSTTNATAITAIEAKTDLITITGATDVDNIRTTTGHITTDGAGITDFNISGSSQVLQLNNVADTATFVKMQLSERSTKLFHIVGDSTGIAGFAIKSGATPITADQVTDASSTNKFTTAANNTKLGFITVTQAVDLDAMEQDVDDIAVAIDLTNNGDAARSGQTGVEVATFSASGVLGSVSDGTRNQFLKTNGLGVLSFDSLELPLASISARVTTTNSSGFYYGSSSFGFNYPIWGSINFNNISGNPYALKVNDDYAHTGIRLPFNVSAVRVIGSVRNDSGTENIEVGLFFGDSPNGDSGHIDLTEIDTTEVTVSVVDRHYDFEIDTTQIIGKGKLLFLGIRRTATTSGTRYINFTATITGKRA